MKCQTKKRCKKTKCQKLCKKQKLSKAKSGFTLLELLVVVTILAIIGGALIAAYDGLESQAAKGVATNTLASGTHAIRTYNVSQGELPNNLETLLAATPTGATHDGVSDSVATSVTGEIPSLMLHSNLSVEKFTATPLTAEETNNLIAAGITRVRYLELEAEDPGTLPFTSAVPSANGGTAIFKGGVVDISIPQHAFEAPRPGGGSDGRNRGRGYALDLASGDTPTLMVWNDGGGYNNVKVGGNAGSVLVGFGIGNSSTIVGASGSFANWTTAPYYGDVKKNEYNHYIMLVDVSVNPARFIALVDSKGDFLDEEFAESTGQK